jgi:hypothetical protein
MKEILKMIIGGTFKNYIGDKIESIIGNIADKISGVISAILGLLFFGIFFFLFFLFATISLAFFISEYLGKNYWGFIIMSGIYLFLGIIFWVFRNSFFKKPILRVLQKSFKCDSINKSNQLK